MSGIDLVELTVEAVQQGFAAGAFTCEALVQACLDRIAQYDQHYNAIIFPNPAALDEARAIDRRRAAGEALGPLAGVPIVVKDTMDMQGFPAPAAGACSAAAPAVSTSCRAATRRWSPACARPGPSSWARPMSRC